jgi:hypothetical protein
MKKELLAFHRPKGDPVERQAARSPEAGLRQGAFPADSDISEQRRLLRELTAGQDAALGLISPILADLTGASRRRGRRHCIA